MIFLYNLILVLHFVGLASLLGGVIVQAKSSDKGVNPAMLHGALTQPVKLVVVLIITVLAFVGRKKPMPQTGMWAAIGALTLLNVVLAVFW